MTPFPHGYGTRSLPDRPDHRSSITHKKLRESHRTDYPIAYGSRRDYPSCNNFEVDKPHDYHVDELYIENRNDISENDSVAWWTDFGDLGEYHRTGSGCHMRKEQPPLPNTYSERVRASVSKRRLEGVDEYSFTGNNQYLDDQHPWHTAAAQCTSPTRQSCGCKITRQSTPEISSRHLPHSSAFHTTFPEGNHRVYNVPNHIRRAVTTEPVVDPLGSNFRNYPETKNSERFPQPTRDLGLPAAFPKYANFSLGPEYTESLYSTLDNSTYSASCSSFALPHSGRKSKTYQNVSPPHPFSPVYTSTGATVGSSEICNGSYCTESDEYDDDDDDTIMSGGRGRLEREGTEITEQHRISSRKSLESALAEVGGKGRDFSQYSTVLLPNKYLGSVLSLKDMTPNAYECDIGFNKLESLRGVPPKTIICNCSHNKITGTKCHLNELPHLEIFDISFNRIGPNLSFLRECLHLRSVNLSHNLLTSLDGLGESLAPIRSLDLSHNEKSGIIDFQALSLIRKNSTTTANREPFGWRGIEELNLGHNKITFIKNISALPNLKVLILDGNPIRGIYDRESCQNHPLKFLSLRDTGHRLKSISFNGIRGLTMKGILRFRTEGFQEMASWISMPTSLVELEVTDTFLECLPKWELLPRNLKTLRLEKIRGLRRLPQNFNKLVPALEKLMLPNNQLESCHNLITVIPHRMLTEIDLRCNPVALKYEMENEDDSEANNNGKNLYSLLLRSRKSLKTILLRGEQ